MEHHRTLGVAQDLHGFDPRRVVEEPPTAGEHHQGMALEFEQVMQAPACGVGRPVRRKGILRVAGAGLLSQQVEDVGIPKRPEIHVETLRLGFAERRERIPEPVECTPQMDAPLLLHGEISVHGASTIPGPTPDTMGARP